ncbi:polysaccharide deacetylase family protein, partial [Nitrolancea hollandica]|uniref:polysaccharide deacetylase family protein n=1 Tax=Nitrolancea hollandica TaxID=1206749 RepID=UPI00058AE060
MTRQRIRGFATRIPHRAAIPLILMLLFALNVIPAAAAAAPSGDPVVYLTFDCESSGVPRVLAALEMEHVNATMFLLGSWAQGHPALVRRMVADGDAL